MKIGMAEWKHAILICVPQLLELRSMAIKSTPSKVLAWIFYKLIEEKKCLFYSKISSVLVLAKTSYVENC